jgi:DNA-binding NarL/FixJ family response regulator
VAIIAKHVLFGSVLRDILSTDPQLQVLGQFQSFGDLLAVLRPQVVVADLDACDYDPGAQFGSWRSTLPELRICVLSTSLDVDSLQRCLNAMIDGYVVTDIPPDQLKKAVTIVASGGSYIDPRVAKQLLQKREEDARDTASLTIREKEVLKLLARGATNKQIAGELGIMERTVKHHITNIFAKLNVSARAQAAVHAIKTGLAK